MDPDDVMETLRAEPVGDLAALERAVAADVARERGMVAWLRSRSRAVRLMVLAGLAAVEVALVVAFAPRPDLDDYPRARLALAFVAATAIVLAASFQSMRPLHLAPRRWTVWAILAVAVAAPFGLALVPPLAGGAAQPISICLAKGVALALPLLLAARALDRRAHAARGPAALAAVGAGVAAVLGLGLNCPSSDPMHLLCAHAPIPAVVVAVYLALSVRHL
jgi:hypothetical protein